MIREHAYAKINLALEIVRKREDGYHELKSLMIPIELKDELIFTKGVGLNFASNVAIADNSIIKVYEVMKNRYNVKEGVSISLIKEIPVGAGLGGGSADIAATIRGLNRFWQLNLDSKEMRKLSIELGSDTLFCLYNSPAIITGRGEYIEFINSEMKFEHITLVVPNYQTSTKEAFKHVTFYQHDNEKFEQIKKSFIENKRDDLKDSLYNDMLDANFILHNESRLYFKAVQTQGLKPHLSGSGSVIYFLDLNQDELERLRELTPSNYQIIKTKQL